MPLEIAPGASETIVCELTPTREGPFQGQLPVYLDDAGLRELVVRVRGQAVKAAGSQAEASERQGVEMKTDK
ncbi:MAG: hypothetical protein C4297_07765 [Gemmataceae bacterium]